MLRISKLSVAVGQQIIINNFSLTIRPGEIHVLMGPNGSGKSSLARALIGDEVYAIKAGTVVLDDQDLLALLPHERALLGLFLAFQQPISIPGVSNLKFLKAAMNTQREARHEEPLDVMEFLTIVKNTALTIGLNESFIYRDVNEGFSGGEKKLNELLQLLLLKPHYAIIDEIDSGLDVDALKIFSHQLTELRTQQVGLLIFSHYYQWIESLAPNYIHVLKNRKIVETGGIELAERISKAGFSIP